MIKMMQEVIIKNDEMINEINQEYSSWREIIRNAEEPDNY